MARNIYSSDKQYESLAEFRIVGKSERGKIPLIMFNTIVDGMPKRCAALLQCHGVNTSIKMICRVPGASVLKSFFKFIILTKEKRAHFLYRLICLFTITVHGTMIQYSEHIVKLIQFISSDNATHGLNC